jgi:hypothetical protein
MPVPLADLYSTLTSTYYLLIGWTLILLCKALNDIADVNMEETITNLAILLSVSRPRHLNGTHM